MEYLNSFEFWIYLVWVSAAVGLGVCIGVYIGVCIGVYMFFIIDSIFKSLANLKFKKDKEK